jgi:hypothetical protein
MKLHIENWDKYTHFAINDRINFLLKKQTTPLDAIKKQN